MTSELTSSEYFELIGELIPELTSSQCNWKGNQKGKGTDETPQCCIDRLFYQLISALSLAKTFSSAKSRDFAKLTMLPIVTQISF